MVEGGSVRGELASVILGLRVKTKNRRRVETHINVVTFCRVVNVQLKHTSGSLSPLICIPSLAEPRGMKDTTDDVMTTFLIEGAFSADCKIEMVPFTAGVSKSPFSGTGNEDAICKIYSTSPSTSS